MSEKRKLILILAGGGDPQGMRVKREVRARGGRVLWCDTRAFPQQAPIASLDGHLWLNRRKAPTPTAVYLRGLACHPLVPAFERDLAERPRGLIAQCDEKRAMLESVLRTLERRGCPVVNTLEANAQHSQKPYQLDLLRAAGLPVPRWLATNDPAAVRRFTQDVGRAIYKPLAGGAAVQFLEPKDLTDERLDALSLAAVLFQEYIEGTSVRAFVVGRRVVAAAQIHSSELDYRRKEDAVLPTRLTPDERTAVVGAARACRMPFTGVDFIRVTQGFVLIECNPSPMFATFERKTALDVAGPFAQFLLRL
ncbi:MAG TPA: ATP-grasp domain-containing protein [Candidatus Hydrogenedentes bacterium]|nr:ATP-grasp domain-containing protein [Candidatus Hydrogenedentota bacterium]